MHTSAWPLVGAVAAMTAVPASGAIISAATPAALDLFMGTPLLPVPYDGSPLGTLYGHPPASTPGIPLATPIGLMGFGPSHDRVGVGTPGYSGAFHASTAITGPIAGSTVYAPPGATAIDFLLAPAAIPYSFEITAIGSSTSTMIAIPASPTPVYVGFGATEESIIAISIVKLPFPSPTTITWIVDDIRVLPAPGSLGLAVPLGILALRRRRRE